MTRVKFIFDRLIDSINELSHKHISMIIEQNARVENYFSVFILETLTKLMQQGEIEGMCFQKHLTGGKRNHIDFYFKLDNVPVLLELKHFAIDTSNSKNRRSLNFYTSNSDSGKKVGLLGDIDKLHNINCEHDRVLMVFAIVTNVPSSSAVVDRLNEIKSDDLKGFKIGYVQSTAQHHLGFISASKYVI